MRVKYQQVLGSFLLGLLVPMTVIRFSQTVAPEQPETQGTPASSSATVSTSPAERKKVRVLTDGGNEIWMDFDTYLVGVILAEMPTDYEAAALQAQAVVARTYALKRQQENRHSQGAVCTDSGCCQAFVSATNYLDGLGYQQDIEKAAMAVAVTRDLVVTYDGLPIEATYFHCSGGRTEDAVAVWGVSYPYLQAVDSPGEESMEHYTDQVYYSKEELEQLLGITLSGEPNGWLEWTTYTTGGGVDMLSFGGNQYRGTEFRKILQLNSTAFSIEPEEDAVRVTTYGKGHRVGMSQSGAEAMALCGCTWQDILSHYYPGTRIDKMENLG